jgi:hypothetical protein
MPHKSLLRHIFRNGPHSRTNTARLPVEPSTPGRASQPAGVSASLSYLEFAPNNGPPESPLAYKSRPDSRQSIILHKIVEESNSDTGGSTSEEEERAVIEEVAANVETQFVTDTLTALNLDIATLTTRGFLTATLNKAKIANRAHLNTIDMTLELLDALKDFSATIEVLRTEMGEKKCSCEEDMALLEDVEQVVVKMQFERKEVSTGEER